MEACVDIQVTTEEISDEQRRHLEWIAQVGSASYRADVHDDLLARGLLDRREHGDVVRVFLTRKGFDESRATEEASFTIHRSHLDRVEAKARSFGLEVVATDVRPQTMLDYWHVPEAVRPLHKSRAEIAAAQLVHVHIQRPRHEERVIAVAVNEEGFPTFSDLPGESYWDQDKIGIFSFCRCDVCGKKIARKNVYIVENLSGERRQIGGDCALDLDLARKVKRFFKNLQELRAWILGDGDEDDFGGFAFSSKQYPGDDPALLYVVFESMRNRYGYVSGKSAREHVLRSTRERGMEFLSLARTRITPSMRPDFVAEVRAAKRELLHFEAEAERRREEFEVVTAFVEEKWKSDGNAFAANLRAAWHTGAWRLVGLVAWLPEAMAKEQERRRMLTAKPYEPEPVPATNAELLVWRERYPQAVVDLELEDKIFERAAKKPDAPVTKAVAGKIARYVPGDWKVCRVGSFDGMFGTTWFFTMIRESDMASVTWRTTTPYTNLDQQVEQGKVYRIVSATLGEVPEPRTLKSGAKVQDGRSIERARVVLATPLSP